MWGDIAFLSFIGCIGMAVQDSVGTFLVRAINTNRPSLAGLMDVASDIAKVLILSISANDLTHSYGWKGYLGLLPILVTAFFVTYHATKVSSSMVDEGEVAEDSERDSRIKALEHKVNGLERANGRV